MAQTKRRRRRKHRGTQGGSVDRARRTSRPRSRQEAMARARSRQRAPRRQDAPPTWSGAVTRGLFGALIFAVLLLLVFGRPIGEAIALAAFMTLFYIPMGYFIERFFWRRRQARRLAEHRR